MIRFSTCTGLVAFVLSVPGCGALPFIELQPELEAMLVDSDVQEMQADAQDPALVRLGQALFFDKILSGNRDISCATCHTPLAGTADGLSLSVGAGGSGLAQSRTAPMDSEGKPILIPRNAPDVFRGQLSTMFWDARVADNGDGSFTSPAGTDLPDDLDSALAVQALFPVTSRDEMRGQPGENEVADLDDDDFVGIWSALMDRLLAIDEYERLFAEAFDDVAREDLTFSHAGKAIAAFEMDLAIPADSPFDLYVAGDDTALSTAAHRGALLFYDEAGCSRCHGGTMMSDEMFHNRAVPQIGPGKGDGADGTFDFGRERVTGNDADRFMFRTPPLRNVAATGPWMHDGAYTSLEAAVRHCLDPVSGLQSYDPDQLTATFAATYHPEHNDAILAAVDADDVQAVTLSGEEFEDLMAFLHSLTSPSLGALSIRATPETVPSDLPMAD